MTEDEVADIGRHVARKACTELCLFVGFSILELSEPPAAGSGIFLGILDHELDVYGRPSNEGLVAAKHLVVLLGGKVTPSESGDDGAVRKR